MDLYNHKHNKYSSPKKWLKHYVAILSLIVIFSFFISISHRVAIFRSGFLAEVLPSVLIDLTNNNRTNFNLSPLIQNPILAEAAKRKAEDMSSKGYFAHESPVGVTPWYWFESVNYNFVYAGENLAIHFSDSSDIVNAWMNSPSHRDNILNGYFTEIGIATSEGMYNGKKTIFVVQMFGRPNPIPESIFKNQRQNLEENNSDTEVLGITTNEDLQNDLEIFEIATQNFEDQMFLAVKRVEAKDLENKESVAGEASPKDYSYSNLIDRLVSSPSSVLKLVYITLGVLVLLLMFLALFIEMRHHHYLHIICGLGIIFLIVIMYFVSKEFFGNVDVIPL